MCSVIKPLLGATQNRVHWTLIFTMTRLKPDEIRDIPEMLKVYDKALIRKTGAGLRGIACRAWGIDESAIAERAGGIRVGVIPISWGLGVIQGFSETVRDIVQHLGFNVFVTQAQNVAGLSEAVDRQSDVIMLSDDDHFVAIHVRTGKSVDNSAATGKVFAAGLDLMAGGLEGQAVLVVGCGPVGRSAGRELLRLGAELSVVDMDRKKARDFAREAELDLNREVRVENNLHKTLLKHHYILDASPAAAIMDERHIADGTLISAPGVPIGLTAGALEAMAGRLLHDPLQLGVAAMIVAAVNA